MAVYAVVENRIVINVVVWDGESEWKPERGETVPADHGVMIGWLWDGNKFTQPPTPEKSHEELVMEADVEKEQRIDEAQQSIYLLQTKLLMGRKLTVDENKRINAVLDYIDMVDAINTSSAPDIDWPQKLF